MKETFFLEQLGWFLLHDPHSHRTHFLLEQNFDDLLSMYFIWQGSYFHCAINERSLITDTFAKFTFNLRLRNFD